MTQNENPLNTKTVLLAIKETRNVEVTVPTATTPDELHDLGEVLFAQGVWDCMDSDGIEVVVEDELGLCPDVRATRKANKWHLVYHPHTAAPLRNRGSTHCKLVEHFRREEKVLEFALVVIEFPTGEITHGVLYFSDCYSVVAAFFADHYCFGILPITGDCYPVDRDTRLLPWTMVDPIEVPEVWSISGLVAFLGDTDEKSDADCDEIPIDHASLPPNLELVRVQPRMAENPHELMDQQNGDD